MDFSVYSINPLRTSLKLDKSLLICTFVLTVLIKLMNLKFSVVSFVYYGVE